MYTHIYLYIRFFSSSKKVNIKDFFADTFILLAKLNKMSLISATRGGTTTSSHHERIQFQGPSQVPHPYITQVGHYKVVDVDEAADQT